MYRIAPILNFLLNYHLRIWTRLSWRLNVEELLGLMKFTRNSLKTFGTRAKEWIVSFFNDILRTGRILKPVKNGTHASHFRPISLLSIFFNSSTNPTSDWWSRSCFPGWFSTTQQLCWTSYGSHITYRTRFQHKLKIGKVFIVLTAVFDTVWRYGLMLKFMRVVARALNYRNYWTICYQIVSFKFFIGVKSSRWRWLNNGIPKESA
jgi:hypothetical protein